jgi:hypothetical protein
MNRIVAGGMRTLGVAKPTVEALVKDLQKLWDSGEPNRAGFADILREHGVRGTCCVAMAWMLERKLNFDPIKQEFVNDFEANSLRSRSARNWV